jgi:Tfp pilus assembly protein PilW
MRTRQRQPEAGFSVLELLISTAIMLAVTGAIFSLVNPSQGTAQTQPEMADLQQRMRIGSDTIFKELLMAGAGPYFGPRTGSLVGFFAPVIPRRTGRTNPDARNVFRPDAITLSYIPNSYSQTTIESAMPPNSAEIKVTYPPNCPQAKDLCGFEEGMVVIIFDSTGHYDTFEITKVQDSAGHLQHRGQTLNHQYEAGATITQIVNNTYYRNAATNQLMRFDGSTTDVALVDNVVGLQFDYFGDPNPPVQPKPATGAGANCLYDAAGNYKGTMPILAANEGSLAALTAAMLSDGPWCGSGTNEFDADLLRIRKVRVTLRMQVGPAALRGTDAALFANPGATRSSAKQVPDYFVRYEVTPRNLNLTR